MLNGDIVDTGYAADVALAKQTLEAGGCDTGDDRRARRRPTADTVPCLYVPGNHESYGTTTSTRGRPSSAQPVPHVRPQGRALRPAQQHPRHAARLRLGAAADAAGRARPRRGRPRRQAVVVFAHHPTNDPDPGDASQLGDRKEVQLIEPLLVRASDKPARMVGSHAQIVNVDRVEGVPYMVLPSSGKSPYGTPDRGGFTGWVRYGVTARRDAAARRRPRVRAVGRRHRAGRARGRLDRRARRRARPAQRRRQRHPPRSAALPDVRPLVGRRRARRRRLRRRRPPRRQGRAPGPDDARADRAARRHGDRRAEADSMREGDDLAPVRGEKTIDVAPFVAPPVTGGAGGTVPATLALTLGAPASFGAFAPGRRGTYTRDDVGDGHLHRGRRDADRRRRVARQRRLHAAQPARGPAAS